MQLTILLCWMGELSELEREEVSRTCDEADVFFMMDAKVQNVQHPGIIMA